MVWFEIFSKIVAMVIFNINFYRAEFHCILTLGLYNMRDEKHQRK